MLKEPFWEPCSCLAYFLPRCPFIDRSSSNMNGQPCSCGSPLLFFFLKTLFIHETERHRQREKQAPCRELDAVLDLGTLGSRPGPKADAQPLSHLGVPPCYLFNITFYFLILFIYFLKFIQRQREKQAPCREPDVGLYPGSPGSHPGLQAALNHCPTGAALTSHFGFAVCSVSTFTSNASHQELGSSGSFQVCPPSPHHPVSGAGGAPAI